MIRRHDWGTTIDILRRDGHKQVYRIVAGQECAALKVIYSDHVFGRLDEHETALLLNGVNQILGNQTPVSPRPLSSSLGMREKMLALARGCRRVASSLIDGVVRRWLSRDEQECAGR